MAFLYRPSVLVLKQNENLSKKAIKKMSKEGLSITEVDNIDKARDQLSLVNYDAVIVFVGDRAMRHESITMCIIHG